MRSRPTKKTSVSCIACGETVSRVDAREYDRFGDRWDRDEKSFEYLCKPCHDRECHLPRQELESFLIEIGDHHSGPVAYVSAYYEGLLTSEDRQGH